MKFVDIQKGTKNSASFKLSLNEALKVIEIESLIEQVCSYLEVINEGFIEKYRRRRDFDWYYASIISPNIELKKLQKTLQERIQAKNAEQLFRIFFAGLVEYRTTVPIELMFIDIISGKGKSKITIGIATKPKTDQTITGGDEEKINWSENLNDLFGMFPQFTIGEGFKLQKSTIPDAAPQPT